MRPGHAHAPGLPADTNAQIDATIRRRRAYVDTELARDGHRHYNREKDDRNQ